MPDTADARDAVKFAYWVPNVSGGLVISNIEQRTDWSIDYNRTLAQIAERSGFEYALSQIRFTAGYGAEFQHESCPARGTRRWRPSRSPRSTISPPAGSPSMSSRAGSAVNSPPSANLGSTTTNAIAAPRSSSAP